MTHLRRSPHPSLYKTSKVLTRDSSTLHFRVDWPYRYFDEQYTQDGGRCSIFEGTQMHHRCDFSRTYMLQEDTSSDRYGDVVRP